MNTSANGEYEFRKMNDSSTKYGYIKNYVCFQNWIISYWCTRGIRLVRMSRILVNVLYRFFKWTAYLKHLQISYKTVCRHSQTFARIYKICAAFAQVRFPQIAYVSLMRMLVCRNDRKAIKFNLVIKCFVMRLHLTNYGSFHTRTHPHTARKRWMKCMKNA